MNNEHCPCCHNHCPKDNLGCNRGKEYFNNQNNSDELTSLEEQVIMELRNCGHLLHHNEDKSVRELFSKFSKEELKELHNLLSKILKN